MAATAQVMSLKPPHDPPRQMTSLYVGDLDPQVTEMDLKTTFSLVGPIFSLRLCRCSVTGKSLCYGYVNFCHPYHAYIALYALNHKYLKGRPMRIMWSQRNPYARKNSIGNLYVKNLDPSIDSASLHRLFSKYGNILSCKVVEEHGKSKGYGFVQFDSEDSALTARTALHDSMLKDKKLYVSRFVKKSERTAATTCEETKFTNLYVKHLAESMTEDAFRDIFSAFGEVSSAVIMKDQNGKSRGFGFVNFKSTEDARRAVDDLNGFQIDSRTLFVARAQKKSERTKIIPHDYNDIFKNRSGKLKASNLYVKNLAASVDDNKLHELFQPCGKITSAKVMRNDSGASRRFGFVCFSRPEEAKKAVNALNGAMFHGMSLYVAIAQRKRERQLELQKTFEQFQWQSPYLSDGSIVPPPINAFRHNSYPYPQQIPFLHHTLSYQNSGANMGVQYPYASSSYHQQFSSYIPVAETYQGFQRYPAYQSCQQSVENGTYNHSDQDLKRGMKIFGSKKLGKGIGGAPGSNPKRFQGTANSSGKSKKVTRNLHPYVENIQPDLSGNIAGLVRNSSSSNSLVLKADRASQVLKEANILERADDAGGAASPKPAACRLDH